MRRFRLLRLLQAGRSRLDLVKFTLAQLLILLLFLLKNTIDPLNLEDESDRITADFYNAAFAPFYGSPATGDMPALDIRLGQQEIVVVLIDEQTLRGNTWPIGLAFYRVLFESLAGFGAKAIFLDIYFQPDAQRDEDVASLFALAEELEDAHGPPVVFASLLADPVPAYAGKTARHVALAETNSAGYTYRLREETGQGLQVTAAWKLYELWCGSSCPRSQAGVATGDDMYVRWGAGPDSVNVTTFTDLHSCPIRSTVAGEATGSDAAGRSFAALLHDSARLSYSRLFTMNRPVDNPSPCVYHRTLSATNVLFPQDTALMQSLLEGKMVLVGTNLPLVRDLTLSPVHGYIPGVYKIAMALDNLMEMGTSYLRWLPDQTGNRIDTLLLFAVLALLIALRAWSSGISDPDAVDRLHFLFSAAILLGLTLIAMAALQLFHVGPNTWTGFLLMFTFVSWPSLEAGYYQAYTRFCQPFTRIQALNITISAVLALLCLSCIVLLAACIALLPILLLSDMGSDNRVWLNVFYLAYSLALVLLIYFMHRVKNRSRAQLSFDY